MLHGDETEKTKKFGFTALSTFGLLRDRSLEWVIALLRALLAAGWIDLTQTEHPVPFLTRAGAEVMKGVSPARIVLPAEPKAKQARTRREPRAQEVPMDESARPLFERLRAHRAALAKERGVPAYVIAFDRTLAEMAMHRPGSRGQLMGIYGMGPSRVESYGDGFLEVIKAPARS
jgi:ATP-dependent DNA helicase RecQ